MFPNLWSMKVFLWAAKRILAATLVRLDWLGRVWQRSSILSLLRSHMLDHVNLVIGKLIVESWIRICSRLQSILLCKLLRRWHMWKWSYWQWSNRWRFQCTWWQQEWWFLQNSLLHLEWLLDSLINCSLIELCTLVTDTNIWQQRIEVNGVLPLSDLSSLRTFSLLYLFLDCSFFPLSVSELLLDFELFETKLLLLVVVCEIVKKFGWRFVIEEDLKHPLADLWENFLAISTLTCWLVLI